MKDIKFRYSVKRENGHTFCTYFTIIQIEKGEAERFLEINHVAPEELHREQFSGFYDINKIEIYEGDTLHIESAIDNKTFDIPVIYKDGCFEAEGSGILVHVCGMNNPEVIGNIHGKD